MPAITYTAPGLYVAGEWIKNTGLTAPIINPATGTEIGRLPHATPALVERALAAADDGFKIWSKTPHTERSAIMKRAADILRNRLEEAAAHLVMEMGKPLAQARTEMENCAILLEWCPDNAPQAISRVLPARPGFRDLRVRRQPIGPIAAFAPWNFPASLAARKAASALAVGCSAIVRPPSETPAAFAYVVRALHEAGLPPGVLNLLYGEPDVVTYPVIDSDVIRKIAFTGSTHVGCLLAARAGARAKPSVMELGGHAPVIISSDVDAAHVAGLSVAAKYRNSGQICVSPTRFYVHDAVYEQFTSAFVAGATAQKLGDGLDPDTQMGPLANPRRVQDVHELIEDAVARGARLLTGGQKLNRPGNFYPPSVLADVPDDARIMQTEPFGPVAVLNRYASLDAALAAANNTPYALGAYGFSRADDEAERLAQELDAGMIAINSFALMTVDSPISGRRFSGYGSEGGPEGLEAYTIPKFTSLAEA